MYSKFTKQHENDIIDPRERFGLRTSCMQEGTHGRIYDPIKYYVEAFFSKTVNG